MEDLARYLKAVVEPTIDDFKKNPASVRHAFLACVVTFHAIDYLAYPKRSRGLRQKYQKLSPDFALVDDVAHAFKHVITGRRDNPALNAAEVISRPAAVVGQLGLNTHTPNDTHRRVTLKRRQNVNLLNVVTGAAEFFRK
jgi:hypothetical protein